MTDENFRCGDGLFCEQSKDIETRRLVAQIKVIGLVKGIGKCVFANEISLHTQNLYLYILPLVKAKGQRDVGLRR